MAHSIFSMSFRTVYQLYIDKAAKKGRSKEEVDQCILWLTGYDKEGLEEQIEMGSDFTAFFAKAPCMNPNASLIKGTVCGCLLYTSPSPRDRQKSRMPSSA